MAAPCWLQNFVLEFPQQFSVASCRQFQYILGLFERAEVAVLEYGEQLPE